MTSSGDGLDSVVAEAVAGDRDALRTVLETIRPIIVRYCRARIGTADRSGLSADDVAQEVCLAAITALPRYKDQGRPFLAFVYGIAAHKVADAHRAAGQNRADATDSLPDRASSAAGPEQIAIDSESAARMDRLLAALPEKQREIINVADRVINRILGMPSGLLTQEQDPELHPHGPPTRARRFQAGVHVVTREPGEQPDDPRDRAPAVDHPQRRSDHRDGQGSGGRARHP